MDTKWMISLLAVLAVVCISSVASIHVMVFSAACQPHLLATCHAAKPGVICYDQHIYPNWCEFANATCNGTARANVTSAYFNSKCNFTVVIRPPVVHPPTLPPSMFETNLFNSAIHGIDDLIAQSKRHNYTVDDMKKIFSVQDHTHKKYVRSSKCWASPLDLTPISPWNSQGKTRKAGVLVTPRHAIWARHYSMHVNTTLRFVDRNNNVVDRRIVHTHVLPVASGHPSLYGYDVVVGELDSDVPAGTISFAKVLPRNLTTIRPHTMTRVPVFDTDFEEKALVADLSSESGTMVRLTTPLTSSPRHELYENKISGDSGNPVFMVVENELVLLFVFTYGGAGSGTSINYHFDDINTILKNWGTNYRLTEVDLRHFLGNGDVMPNIIG